MLQFVVSFSLFLSRVGIFACVLFRHNLLNPKKIMFIHSEVGIFGIINSQINHTAVMRRTVSTPTILLFSSFLLSLAKHEFHFIFFVIRFWSAMSLSNLHIVSVDDVGISLQQIDIKFNVRPLRLCVCIDRIYAVEIHSRSEIRVQV